MKAVILANELGGGLKSGADEVHNPMKMVAGQPFLEHHIRFLREFGIKEIILVVHHMANTIKSYFGNGLRLAVDITYSEEDIPLGTAGAIKKAEKYIDDTFLVLNGDFYSNIDINELIKFHNSKRSNFTLSLTRVNNPSHYRNVLLRENKVMDFLEKEANPQALINTRVYVFEPIIFDYIEAEKNISLEKEIFPRLAKENLLFGYVYNGYFRDIGQPETYQKFKEDIINTLQLEETHKVRDAMNKITKSGINIVIVTNDDKKLLGVINDRIMKEYMLRGGNLDDTLSKAMIRDPIIAKESEGKDRISELLMAGINHLPVVDNFGRIKDIEFRVEKLKTETFPVIRGKAPLRISFAGGGTDIQNFFEKYGGVVINATIDKYCHATLIKRADSKIIINSDLGEDLIINSRNDLHYDGRFDLIKSVINILKPDFGFELYLHNDLPPGRGLGSSASLSTLIISLLSYLQDAYYDDYKIAELAYKVEREELKIKGGWQDQYAAVTGGFNFMEFNGEKKIIYPLKLKEEVINELNHHMLLCYVGKSHNSGDIHKSQEISFEQNESLVDNYKELKKIAVEIKDSLLTNQIEKIGHLLNEAWENKRKLESSISDPIIDALYTIGLKNGVYGGKLLGAGGGGYILFFYSPKKRNELVKALEKAGGNIMNFNFEFKGIQLWPTKQKT